MFANGLHCVELIMFMIRETRSPKGDFLMECQEKDLLLAQKVSFLGKRSPKIIFLQKKNLMS